MSPAILTTPSEYLNQPNLKTNLHQHEILLNARGWNQSIEFIQKTVLKVPSDLAPLSHFEHYNPKAQLIRLEAWIMRHSKKIEVPLSWDNSRFNNLSSNPDETTFGLVGITWPMFEVHDVLFLRIHKTAIYGVLHPYSDWQRISIDPLTEQLEIKITAPQKFTVDLLNSKNRPWPQVKTTTNKEQKTLHLTLNPLADTSSQPNEVLLIYTVYKGWAEIATEISQRFNYWKNAPRPLFFVKWLGPAPTKKLTIIEAQSRLNDLTHQLIRKLSCTNKSDLLRDTYFLRSIDQIFNSKMANSVELSAIIVLAARHIGLVAELAFTNSGLLPIPLPYYLVFPERYFKTALAQIKYKNTTWWVDATQLLSNVGITLPEWDSRLALVTTPKTPLQKIEPSEVENNQTIEVVSTLLNDQDAKQMLYLSADGHSAWYQHSKILDKSINETMDELTYTVFGFKLSQMLASQLWLNQQSTPLLQYDPLNFKWTAKFGFNHMEALKDKHTGNLSLPIFEFKELVRLVKKFGSSSIRACQTELHWLGVIGTYNKIQALDLSDKLHHDVLPTLCHIQSPWFEFDRSVTFNSEYSPLSGDDVRPALVVDSKLVVKQPFIKLDELNADILLKAVTQVEKCLQIDQINLAQ